MALEFLTEAGFLPFSVALAVLFLIALLELAGLVVGHSLSHTADSWLPDLHLGDGALSAFDKLMAWLYLGKVPAVALLAVFLASFGLGGMLLQEGCRWLLGQTLNPWLASGLALVPALFGVRTMGRVAGKALAKSESDAVSTDTLIGRRATVTLGTARRGSPAQAKVRDQHGRTHYLMLEPSSAENAFPQGTEVTLVERKGSIFTAV